MKQMRKVVVSEWTKLRGASADGAFKVFDTLPKSCGVSRVEPAEVIEIVDDSD
jgi:hypothetical protein